MKSTVYDNGEAYDKIFNDNRDIELWRELTKKEKTVLELCCGTGRIMASLLPGHSNITGIDNSRAMLVQAKAKTKVFRNKVQLYHRNITRFNLGRTFHSVLLVNNSFNHLLSEADVLKFQQCLKKHMDSDTKFILQVYVKNILQYYTFNKFTPYASYIDIKDGKNIEVLDRAEYNPKNKLIKREWYYYKENKLLRKKRIYVRIYDRVEIKNLFRKNGFYFTQEYGGYKLQPFDSLSPTHIIVMKKSEI